MKKYIIVSIIVAALFIGGSVALVKAQQVAQARTFAKTAFVEKMAANLILDLRLNLSQSVVATSVGKIITQMGSGELPVGTVHIISCTNGNTTTVNVSCNDGGFSWDQSAANGCCSQHGGGVANM